MRQALAVIAAILLLLPAMAPTPAHGATKPKPAVPAATQPLIDERATDLVKVMSDYLGGLDRFSVHVDTVRDAVMPSGLIVNGDRATDLFVNRPNQFRANITSAARDAQVYYDGTTVSIFSPGKNYYGNWPAPLTIDETIQRAAQRYGMAFPGADLLLSNPYPALMKNVAKAFYVGKSLIRGDLCHHLAFRQKDLDWQLWVDAGANPLPRRIVLVERNVKGAPRIASTFTDWNISPTFNDDTFKFVPPPGAQKIKASPARGIGPNVAPKPKAVK